VIIIKHVMMPWWHSLYMVKDKKMKPFSLDYDLIDKGIFFGWLVLSQAAVHFLPPSTESLTADVPCSFRVVGIKTKIKNLIEPLCQMDSEPWIGSPVTSLLVLNRYVEHINKKNDKSDGSIRSAHQAMRIQVAPARNPSTARSGKWSLLCETSLTLCPPL